MVNESKGGLAEVFDISRYVSAKQLFRITAFVLRFIKACRKRAVPEEVILSTEEILETEMLWIKQSQATYPPTSNQRQQLGIQSSDQNILICHGRFDISQDEQPIYLSKKDPLGQLIIADAHRRVLHMGVETTLAELRARFWIPNGRQMVKKVLQDCQRCKRYTAQS